MLNAQASEQVGAGPYERSEDRQNYRNGSRERRLNTMIGKLRLAGASGEKAFSGSGLPAPPVALAVLSLPLSIRRRLRTINGLERLNGEPRRRERVIGIFPNEQSVDRMMAAPLMETNERAAGRAGIPEPDGVPGSKGTESLQDEETLRRAMMPDEFTQFWT